MNADNGLPQPAAENQAAAREVGGLAAAGTRIARVLACAAACASMAAHAEGVAGAAGTPTEIGDATHAWLDLQRGNTQAAPAQPTLGAEAGLAYQRYLDSFKTKIPETFGSSVSKNGGGGAGNAD